MTKTFALILASTAVIGLPAVGALYAPVGGGVASVNQQQVAQPILISGEDEEDEDEGEEEGCEEEEEEEDEDGSDDDDCLTQPAPTGPVSPPANGLFGNGAPPTVQIN